MRAAESVGRAAPRRCTAVDTTEITALVIGHWRTERVRAALPGVEVDLGDAQAPEGGDWFFAAVTE